MAVDSKPTHDQKAKKRPKPAAGPVKALTGERGSSGMPSGPPPASSTATAMMARMEISVMRKTPRIRAVMLMAKNASAQLRASMPKANTCHGTASPSWLSTVEVAKAEKMPMSDASKTT